MLALYILSFGASAGVIGVFARSALAAYGYVPGLQSGFMAALGAAACYAALQAAFLGIVLALWPTRDRGYLVVDCVSHACVLVFVPYLLHVSVDWPHPALTKFEPLVYFGAFLFFHGLAKLMSFYAVLRSEPARSFSGFAWLGIAVMGSAGAYAGTTSWLHDLQAARPVVLDATAPYCVDSQYAIARIVQEGALFECPVEGAHGRALTVRWANVPDAAPEELQPVVYVTVEFEGGSFAEHSDYLPLNKRGWTTLRIGAEEIPEGTGTIRITWHASKEPSWRRMIGLRPVFTSGRRVLMSGPFFHVAEQEGDSRNFVIVCVDGMRTERLSSMGYSRDTTPSLDRLVLSGRSFVNAFTPVPEGDGAVVSALTGVSPLRHGFIGRVKGPLPEGAATVAELLERSGYATAAFTEGDAAEDLLYGRGIERGFEMYDTSYVSEPANAQEAAGEVPPGRAGCQETLAKAREWIERHGDAHFMVFVRLHELRDAQLRGWYGGKFVKEGVSPSPEDIYDTALAFVDAQLGAFVKHIRDYDTGKRTCVVLMAPYGVSAASRSAQAALDDAVLRVPLVLYDPQLGKGRHTEPVSLLDIAPTVLELAHVGVPIDVEGRNLRVGPFDGRVVSMAGDPLTFVVRNKEWRLVYDSTWQPFSGRRASRQPVARLYAASAAAPRDVASSHADLVREWCESIDAAAAKAAVR